MFKRLFLLSILITFPITEAFPWNISEDQFITDYLWQKVTRLKPPHRPKVSLVLGGGGARGLSHIGVLKVLKEENVPIDAVVGTSVGAIVGALYCADVSIEKIEKMGESIGWDDLTNLSPAALVKLLIAESLLSTEKMEKFLKVEIGNARFDELKVPFACVATDLLTGERIIFREGDVALAVRASATVPGIFEPVEYRHRYLVDGGLVDNVPTDVARFLGSDFTIAVTAAGDFSKNSVSNVFMVLTQAIYIQGKLLEQKNLGSADIVIQPNVSGVSSINLGSIDECIEEGIDSAKKSVYGLKQKLIDRTSDYYLFN